MDRYVGLGQPLSLNVNALLSIVLINKVLPHQVGDSFDLLVFECTRIAACSECFPSSFLQGLRARSCVVISVFSVKETLFVSALMVVLKRAKTFPRPLHSPVSQMFEFKLVALVDHAHDWLGLDDVNLGVLVHELIRGSGDSESVIANKSFGFLLGLAVVNTEWSGDAS